LEYGAVGEKVFFYELMELNLINEGRLELLKM
jgi:hypothetical protein